MTIEEMREAWRRVKAAYDAFVADIDEDWTRIVSELVARRADVSLIAKLMRQEGEAEMDIENALASVKVEIELAAGRME